MSPHKILPGNRIGRLLVVVVLALFIQPSVSQGAGQLLCWPLNEAGIQSRTNETLESYEVRKGQIALAPELLPGPAGPAGRRTGIAASKGDADTFSISLFADVMFEVIIDSVEDRSDGTLIISGRIKDHKIGTVVMTIGPDGFLITVQDMNRSMLYRVTGDSHQGAGTVTEIDMKKIPPMIR